MKFEFAKYTEVTSLAHQVNSDYKENGVTRVFICPDVFTFWLVRIMPNCNEHYQKREGVFLLERDNIEKEHRSDELTLELVKNILENDSFECYDSIECFSEEDAIDNLDDGLGIFLENPPD